MPDFGVIDLIEQGAVAFGYNTKFQWHWKDSGDPEKEGPLLLSPPAVDGSEIQVGFNDSGIGSMNSSSAASRSSASVNQQFHRDERTSRTSGDYTVGIVCALQKELLAVRALFDSRHDGVPIFPPIYSHDANHYALGSIQQHNVVAACLPSGEHGTCAAADVLSHMRRSFTEIKSCLLVGIGGGVPSRNNDIRLGDVVVSHPDGTFTGVVQYDLGKMHEQNIFERTGSLQRPPRFVMTAISSLRSDPDLALHPL
ncbi:hypothetical protein AA313_de0207582 [Arthrobotrys entomopaga]|nr:hypothetical protein AA313_de0207582 [Arthrobotrys entomopaga]